MFPTNGPYLPSSGNIVAETKFASQEAKMFPKKFRNNFVAETMFPSLPPGGEHDKTSTRNNVSATMFPSLPRA